MTKLMIFDLDGTLLDTIRDLTNATNWVLKRHGYPTHPTQAYHYFVGNGVTRLIERALPQQARKMEIIKELQQEQVAYYQAHCLEQTAPFPGVAQALRALRQRDVLLAVATNKPNAPAQQLVRKFFAGIDFFAICGQREGVPTKPDPTVLLSIIEHAGVEKAQVLYFGDSDVDMLAAQNAGVKGIGVSWGYRTRQELQRAGAHAIIDKPEDFLRLEEKIVDISREIV